MFSLQILCIVCGGLFIFIQFIDLFYYIALHIEVIFSDRIKFKMISNNIKIYSIPFFLMELCYCTVFMDS